jgi:septal ring factor EnvC (AmiA/AmiB activator)
MRPPRAALPAVVMLALGALPGASAEAQQGYPPTGVTATTPTDVDRLLARAEADERQLGAELEDARPRLEITRKRIIGRGRSYYRLVRAGLLPAGGGFDALVDHAAHVERTRRALIRDVAAESTLVKRIGELEGKLTRVRSDRGPLEVQREALHRARAALQEAEERRSAFTRAFETSVRPDASVAIYGTDFGPAPDARAGFRSLRGRLPFPIAGRAEVNRVNHGGGPGVELMAPSGTVVRSVAAGRVSFSDRYDDYGLTVILDHGDHYYTLYASLGSNDVHVGDSVPAGSRLGTVGSVDGKPTHLYFELRHNASTLDPAPWLGL